MDDQQLSQAIRAIFDRGSPRYTTPSGALFELLRTWAESQDLSSIAEACELYICAHPHASAFVAASLPAILVNSYFTVRPGFDYEKFVKWQAEKCNWSEQISLSFTNSAGLAAAVENVVNVVAEQA